MHSAHFVGEAINGSITLVRPLATGPMSTVWVADHAALRTEVVVKFLAPSLARDPISIERFSREAAAAAKVKSPHVVQIFDHGVTADGAPFIVMELLEGWDLGEYIRVRGRLSVSEAAIILSQLSQVLTAVHARGIVHRDLKPQNIFLCDSGAGDLFVKLLDFGVAKGIGQTLSPLGATTTIGTAEYMSPEQTMGARDLDLRSDLWSLGVVMFELLTGQSPFRGETFGAIARAVISAPIPIPSQRRPELGPAIDAWFRKACARSLPQRYASARTMSDDFVAIAGTILGSRLPAPSFHRDPFASMPPMSTHGGELETLPPPTPGRTEEELSGESSGERRIGESAVATRRVGAVS